MRLDNIKCENNLSFLNAINSSTLSASIDSPNVLLNFSSAEIPKQHELTSLPTTTNSTPKNTPVQISNQNLPSSQQQINNDVPFALFQALIEQQNAINLATQTQQQQNVTDVNLNMSFLNSLSMISQPVSHNNNKQQQSQSTKLQQQQNNNQSNDLINLLATLAAANASLDLNSQANSALNSSVTQQQNNTTVRPALHNSTIVATSTPSTIIKPDDFQKLMQTSKF